ncbi:hypothetical protein ANN_03260 [Periplaneta americana]|uniref:Helix-turn-helix domain-containing protein n=1 Tax=Periplaneta americana TaxID=6978 RepID=A0ABQ8U1C4_PERAM|nr:hypothetical protein ANN_03260 [Periplaneta americana]
MEVEQNKCIPFLDVLVTRYHEKLATRVYRKSTHTGRYLRFESNHPIHIKRGIISTLHNRATSIRSKESDLQDEVQSLTNIFVSNGYPYKFINRTINNNRKNKDIINFLVP